MKSRDTNFSFRNRFNKKFENTLCFVILAFKSKRTWEVFESQRPRNALLPVAKTWGSLVRPNGLFWDACSTLRITWAQQKQQSIIIIQINYRATKESTNTGNPREREKNESYNAILMASWANYRMPAADNTRWEHTHSTSMIKVNALFSPCCCSLSYRIVVYERYGLKRVYSD